MRIFSTGGLDKLSLFSQPLKYLSNIFLLFLYYLYSISLVYSLQDIQKNISCLIRQSRLFRHFRPSSPSVQTLQTPVCSNSQVNLVQISDSPVCTELHQFRLFSLYITQVCPDSQVISVETLQLISMSYQLSLKLDSKELHSCLGFYSNLYIKENFHSKSFWNSCIYESSYLCLVV